MKHFYFSLLLSLFLVSSSIHATHLKGGEIYWECLNDGRFVFYLNIFTDCNSPGYIYNYSTTKDIFIRGNILPKNEAGIDLTKVTVQADTIRYQQTNFSLVEQKCLDSLALGFSCTSNDPGSIRIYPFKSDTIVLKGTPPASGWTFYFGESTRGQTQNFDFSTFGLRSIMYRIANPNGNNPPYLPVDSCMDNAVVFAAKPQTQFCRDQLFSFTHLAQDDDLDSINYTWGLPADNQGSNRPFKVGYGINQQFPGKNFDSLNNQVPLNRKSGYFAQSIYNGSGFGEYTSVIKADSWRCGEVISSIYREVSFFIRDCEQLDSTNNLQNQNPKCFFNGQETNYFEIEASVGDLIEFDFRAEDPDRIAGQKQIITVEPKGDLFSSNFQFVQNCKYNGECATLTPSPSFLSLAQLNEYAFRDTVVQTRFRWQSSCATLAGKRTSSCDNVDQAATVTILFKVYDDVCPIRGSVYATVVIHLKPKAEITAPIIKGASVEFDGKINLQWVPPIDSSNSFKKYDIEAATVNNATNPNAFLIVQNNVNNYKQERKFPYLNFAPNPWNLFPAGKDYYFRMKTNFGCAVNKVSTYAENTQVIELQATASSNNEVIQLNWNAAKPSNAATRPYYIYESPTWYHIWQNNDANSDLTNLSNWYLRKGATKSKSKSILANTCSPLVAYRVEARDTVITYQQGAGILDSLYDTLTFSTFGVMAVSPMQLGAANVLDQQLDYLYADIDGADAYQWINCNTNSIISNANLSEYIPLDTGRFRVIVGNGNCADTSACYLNSVLLDTAVTVVNNGTLRSNSGNQKFQWLDCRADTLIPGANGRSFSPSDTGYYAVEVSAYGYKDTSECIAMLAIGIKETKKAEAFSIYPNPSTGKLFIQSNNTHIGQIRVFNQSGQVILDQFAKGQSHIEINLEETKGIYFIEITDSEGIKTRKKIMRL